MSNYEELDENNGVKSENSWEDLKEIPFTPKEEVEKKYEGDQNFREEMNLYEAAPDATISKKYAVNLANEIIRNITNQSVLGKNYVGEPKIVFDLENTFNNQDGSMKDAFEFANHLVSDVLERNENAKEGRIEGLSRESANLRGVSNAEMSVDLAKACVKELLERAKTETAQANSLKDFAVATKNDLDKMFAE